MQKILDLVSAVVSEANMLRLKYAKAFDAHIGYCCIFCHSDEEYAELDEAIRSFGSIAQDTPTGFTYLVPTIQTVAGELRIVKIRKPDITRTERGDADFSLVDYASFKQNFQSNASFKLIVRPNNEMFELMDSNFDVRCYFSNPPVEEHAGIKEALSDIR